MIQSVYGFIAAAVAWVIALAFFRLWGAKSLLHAAVTGLLCGGVCYGLQSAELSSLFLPAAIFLFCVCLMTVGSMPERRAL